MSSEVYYPSPGEYLSIGIIGLFLYSIIITLSSLSLARLLSNNNNNKSKSTKRFFSCILVMALFELPRYILMIITRSYTSEIAYCCHIVAGFFFFLAFSIVCFQWSVLLQLGYFSAVYGVHGLVIGNNNNNNNNNNDNNNTNNLNIYSKCRIWGD